MINEHADLQLTSSTPSTDFSKPYSRNEHSFGKREQTVSPKQLPSIAQLNALQQQQGTNALIAYAWRVSLMTLPFISARVSFSDIWGEMAAKNCFAVIKVPILLQTFLRDEQRALMDLHLTSFKAFTATDAYAAAADAAAAAVNKELQSLFIAQAISDFSALQSGESIRALFQRSSIAHFFQKHPQLNMLQSRLCSELSAIGLEFLAEDVQKVWRGELIEGKRFMRYAEQFDEDILTDINALKEFIVAGNGQGNRAVRVMLLGPGGAGKSSLRDLLFRRKTHIGRSATIGISLSDTSDNTHPDNVLNSTRQSFKTGVIHNNHCSLNLAIHQEHIACSIPNDLSLYVWDFGGQSIFHNLHRGFIRKENCVYVLVVDSRHEQEPEEWLAQIRLHTQSSFIEEEEEEEYEEQEELEALKDKINELASEQFTGHTDTPEAGSHASVSPEITQADRTMDSYDQVESPNGSEQQVSERLVTTENSSASPPVSEAAANRRATKVQYASQSLKQMRGAKVSVLVVTNCYEGVRRTQNKHRLIREFPELLSEESFFELSCINADSKFDSFVETLVKTCIDSQHVISDHTSKVIKQLKERFSEQHCINSKQLNALIQEALPETQELEALDLVKSKLDSLGQIIQLDANHYCLDPNWIIEQAYQAINHPTLLQHGGILRSDQFYDECLPDEEPDNVKRFLQAHAAMYEFQQDGDMYCFFPDAASNNEPIWLTEFLRDSSLSRVVAVDYSFETFPLGFKSRFVIKVMQHPDLSVLIDKHKCNVWRDGLFVCYREGEHLAKMLVEYHTLKQTIRLKFFNSEPAIYNVPLVALHKILEQVCGEIDFDVTPLLVQGFCNNIGQMFKGIPKYEFIASSDQ